MNHRGTPENLKPFPSGRSGNPSGRPKSPLTDRLREKLDDPSVLDEVVDALIVAAAMRDVGALRTLWERIEGKLTDKIEHEGGLTIRVEYADADDHAAEAPSGAGPDPA